MRRLTDKKPTSRILLQSLPITVAAIAFVIYGASMLPWPAERMVRSVTVIERVSYYRICADGRPAIWFRSLGDSCMPAGLSDKAGPEVTTKTYTAGCWVNRYPLFPSCGGLILTANGGSSGAGRTAPASVRLHDIVRKKACETAEELRRLERREEEAGYYMRVHNVNDDGYNVMAAYTAELERRKDNGRRVLKALRRATSARRLTMQQVTVYTMLHTDSAGNVTRKVCRAMTRDGRQPFRLLQTADGKMAPEAAALYLHCWLTPQTEAGDSIVAASIPGMQLYGFRPAGARAEVYEGAATSNAGHDLPPLLVTDGSPIFTTGGRLAGFSLAGRIVKPDFFGFALKKLYR